MLTTPFPNRATHVSPFSGRFWSVGVPIRSGVESIADYSPFGVLPIAIGMDGTVSEDVYRRGFYGMLKDTWFSGTESLSGVNPEWSFGGTSGEISSRTTSTQEYRYGYNGMEMDNEAKGEGNSYTTEFRQYDPRLGRWLSLDPLMAQFPWQSPYCAFDNNPVYFTDPLGLAAETNGGKPKPKEYSNAKLAAILFSKSKKDSYVHKYDDGSRSVNFLNKKGNTQTKYFKQKHTIPESLQKIRINNFKEVSESSNPNIPNFNEIIKNSNLPSKGIVEGDVFDFLNQIIFGNYRQRDNGWGIEYYDYHGNPTIPPITGMPPDIGFSKGASLLKSVSKTAVNVTVKTSMKLLPQFASSTIEDAVALTMKQKGIHIFANKLHPKPYLNQLSQQMGGQENVIRVALQNANGRFPASGIINDLPVNVGGMQLYIKGYIINGKPIINSIHNGSLW